jgi:sporulation protein YlmC with PRC-barrel domain
MKRVLLSAAIMAVAALPALAQNPSAPAAPSPPAAQGAAPAAQRPSEVSAQRLIGRTVRNLQDETVGDVNSVMITRDGAVSAVIVGVGGFLGIGEREVAIRWQDMQIRDNGDDVRTTLGKDAVRALPEYRYAEDQRRGTVFTQSAQRDAAPAAADASRPQQQQQQPQQPQGQVARTAPETAPRTVGPTPDALSANAIIGASVRDGRNESIGRVYDIILDARGTPQTIVISVGGVLGMGGRRAAVPLSDVRFMRDGDAVFLATGLTTDELQRMPEYRPR